MNTKRARIKVSNTYIDSEIVSTCPYCSAFIHPTARDSKTFPFDSNHHFFIVSFHVTCCDKLFFSAYKKDTSGSNAELVLIYPSPTPERIPETIETISPRFVSLFKQASVAESMGHIELAGSGYRNALEVLIKDYAINELGKPEEEAASKKLYPAIGEYVPNVAISAADVVRVLGNDYTHYQRRYDDIDFQILKRYLHIFINALENDYLLRHPVVNTNRS